MSPHSSSFIFFFNDTATTEIYTLSLHDALPIWRACVASGVESTGWELFAWVDRQCLLDRQRPFEGGARDVDRKSTRLNSSHLVISYAVFCLKKKKIYHDSNLGVIMLLWINVIFH